MPHDLTSSANFVTHFDWHMTVKHLATYPAPPPTPTAARGFAASSFGFLKNVTVPVGASLLSPGFPLKRTCALMKIPPSLCSYSVKSDGDQGHPIFEKLMRLMHDQIRTYNNNTLRARNYCTEIPLPRSFDTMILVSADGDVEATGTVMQSKNVNWRISFETVSQEVTMTRVESWNRGNAICLHACTRTSSRFCKIFFSQQCVCPCTKVRKSEAKCT